MEWNQFTYQRMNSISLDSQNSFIVQTFSLYHFSVMNTHCQKHRVHNLTQEELDDVVIETFGKNDDGNEPRKHINSIREDVMLQKHISHHENERHGKFNL